MIDIPECKGFCWFKAKMGAYYVDKRRDTYVLWYGHYRPFNKSTRWIAAGIKKGKPYFFCWPHRKGNTADADVMTSTEAHRYYHTLTTDRPKSRWHRNAT